MNNRFDQVKNALVELSRDTLPQMMKETVE